MLFTQIEFYFLLAAVFAAVVIVKNHAAQKWILLLASYYFYAYWDWRFAGLLFSCTAVNYWVANRLALTEGTVARKCLLATTMIYSLGVLGFFKYFNFFTESFRTLLGYSPDQAQTLDIILPVGISFYTFQTVSYTIDVYRKELKPCRRLSDLALYVAFFPQLVAGPIVRASEFLPQLETPRTLTWPRAYDGFRQFAFGLFKKVFIADQLAGFIDPAFANSAALSGLTLWIAVLAYAIQIYCDFSGYSDMAIGIARAMGYDFSRNFDHPYISTSVQDFWRRWHISLSTWLRDYLYIPLGGNRSGKVRTYINLMLTMLLGGLWHGASWTFLVWGAIHGAALCADRLYRTRNPRGSRGGEPKGWKAVCGWALTLLVVLVAWTFFRAPDISSAIGILARMFTFSSGLTWFQPFTIAVISLFGVHHILIARGKAEWMSLRSPTVAAITILFTLIWLVIAFYPRDFQPFIYFQF